MMIRREDETVTQFTLRRLSYEIISTELQDLAREFDAMNHEHWTSSEVADYLLRRAENHPAFEDKP